MAELLRFVDDLLNRHGILHWVDYGTLLGAVRDGTLIPWDEDVDFGILEADAQRVRALQPEIEKDGFFVDPSHPRLIRIAYSKANQNHADLFIWDELDGLLAHQASARWDWPGMQDRSAFPRTFLDQLESVPLFGSEFPAPSPVHTFLREHRYGADYMTPKRPVFMSRLHFRIDSPDMSPLVQELLDSIAQHEQRLRYLVRRRSAVIRASRWESDSTGWKVWSALPFVPSPRSLELLMDRIEPEDRTPIVSNLVHSLAWLASAIDELEHPPRRFPFQVAYRRVRRLGTVAGDCFRGPAGADREH